MSSRWHVLHLDHDRLPQLLVKAEFSASGYTIYLTDTCRIWSETLTKREINKRALNRECSIDSSEGQDQFNILLQKIEDALAQKDGTTFNVTARGDDSLILSLTAPLPHPLPEFAWQAELCLLGPEHLESQLTAPLLHQSWTLQSQVQSLIRELHEKDRVISKICDRLETSGNELSIPFPQVSGVKLNRKSTRSHREQLAPHVRALGDFDEAAWKKQWQGKKGVGSERLESGLLDEAVVGLEVANGQIEKQDGNWWRLLTDSVESGGQARQQGKTNGSQSQSSGKSSRTLRDSTMADESIGDEEFQRQGTPPHLKKPTATHGSQQKDETQRVASSFTQEREPPSSAHGMPEDDSTEDEDDLDAPTKSSARPQKSLPSRSQRPRTTTPDTTALPLKKLGVIGGSKRQPSPAKEPSPVQHPSLTAKSASEKQASPPPQPRSRLGVIGGKKLTSTSTTPEPKPEQAAPSPSKPHAKLGTIGGKSKSSKVADHTAPQSSAAEISDAPSPRKVKLGAIGGNKRGDTIGSSRPSSRSGHAETHEARGETGFEESQRRSRKTEKEATPPPRETSEERANRKRNELKRQLEEKSKGANAAKKKRKF
ncbi:hypothetical protein B0A50_06329 [Salinomyces thailandicus]|uniref:Non-homologous end-joining factor 1 n=1 Tax=Salinomyces thailandicus TaxID=706561 RepID=A0A4U0TU36_9PEZI|nr:hypothetical protein B0A50_06329 [Salinomyces thailandica]